MSRYRIVSFIAALLLVVCSATAPADGGTYFVVPIDRVQITEGELPTNPAPRQRWRWRDRPDPRIWLSSEMVGDGEIYLRVNDIGRTVNTPDDDVPAWADIAICLPAEGTAPQAVHGTMALPDEGATWDSPDEWRLVNFSLSADTSSTTSAAFAAIKAEYYEELRVDDIPGAAWFRHQARSARKLTGQADDNLLNQRRNWRRNRARVTSLEETFDLFTGARAMAENLALDRVLQADTESSEPTVDVDSIEGITVEEIDWSQYRTVEEPEIDPLAKHVPADQYAVFFPDFASLTKTIDEARDNLTPILRSLDPKAIDYMTTERYEKQLCLELDGMARLLGGTLIKSVAITGSDPYLRSGSDVAVLFETDQPDALIAALVSKAEGGSTEGKIKTSNVEYSVLRQESNPERSTIAGKKDNVVIVTNSPVQAEKWEGVLWNDKPAMADLEEYLYFREIYEKNPEKEVALIVLTDAAIRKWCGPVWRIGASRRAQALALLSEVTASDYINRTGDNEGKTYETFDGIKLPPDSSGVDSTEPVAVLDRYGTLEFQTPIAELNIEKVTKQERDAYLQWKRSYEQNWRQAFDPIAIRLNITDTELDADVTIMPLIAGSDYREMIELTNGPALEPGDADPHPEALLHFAVSLNPDSRTVRSAEGFMMSMAPGELQKPLGWVGNSAALYFDESPMWEEIAESEDPEEYMEENFTRIPVGLFIDATNGLKLAAFLAAVRSFIQQSAPGMVVWETLNYEEQPYVRIGPAPGTVDDDNWEDFAIYYTTAGGNLTLSLSEEVVQRATARGIVSQQSDSSESDAGDGNENADEELMTTWLGEHYNMNARRGVLDIIAVFTENEYRDKMQRASWGNIPILNEWRALGSETDPVTFHQEIWKERLVCPGGGEYVWNEEWQTIESTVYGHPAGPKDGPGLPSAFDGLTAGNFGLTFLDDGLRARTILRRK